MARQRGRIALTLLAVLGFAGPAAADDWARFRGPGGAGVSMDKNIPVKWGADDVLWKVELPGKGHSSPIVSGGRIFLQTASVDGLERAIVCLEERTGRRLWSTPAPGKPARIHSLNSFASGTPAADAERVYTVFWDGNKLTLFAANCKTGEKVWERDLGAFRSQHGPGHSPVVHDGRVFVADDQDGSAVLLCFDARTGADLWKAERKAFRACYSTPYIRKVGDKEELVVASTAGITAYKPATGAEVWNFTWQFAGMALRTVSSPVETGGMIFAGSGDGSGERNFIAIRPGTGGDAELVWDERKLFPYVPTLIAYRDHLFSVTDDGYAACHVAATGELLWRERLGKRVTASPVLIDGKIYAVADDGTVFVFGADTKYRLLAKNALGESVSASPAVAGGKIYFRTHEHLVCVGKKK